MKQIALFFILLNFLITLPIKLFYPQDSVSFKTALISIVLFSVVWLIVLKIIYIGKNRKMDGIALALGGVIGVKFFGSMVIFLFMFFMGLLSTKVSIAIFLLVYAVYALLIAIYGNRLVKD